MKDANGKPGSNPVSPAVATSTGSNRKERSVLQAKLTKLAIQIGYAGLSVKFTYVHLADRHPAYTETKWVHRPRAWKEH